MHYLVLYWLETIKTGQPSNPDSHAKAWFFLWLVNVDQPGTCFWPKLKSSNLWLQVFVTKLYSFNYFKVHFHIYTCGGSWIRHNNAQVQNASSTVEQCAQNFIIFCWNMDLCVKKYKKVTSNLIIWLKLSHTINCPDTWYCIEVNYFTIWFQDMRPFTRWSTYSEVKKHALLIADEPSFIVSKVQVSSFKIVKIIRKKYSKSVRLMVPPRIMDRLV